MDTTCVPGMFCRSSSGTDTLVDRHKYSREHYNYIRRPVWACLHHMKYRLFHNYFTCYWSGFNDFFSNSFWLLDRGNVCSIVCRMSYWIAIAEDKRWRQPRFCYHVTFRGTVCSMRRLNIFIYKINRRDKPYQRFQSQGHVQGHQTSIGMHVMHKSTVMPALNVIA